ncbi:MAG: helix-turn-helix transcriptional regulator [Tepidiformaceae bacterium]
MAASGKDDRTPREREVLELVLQRWHDKEIAEYLVVSVRTVETHVAHIFQKLGVHSRDQLTDLAEDQ